MAAMKSNPASAVPASNETDPLNYHTAVFSSISDKPTLTDIHV